MSCSSRRSGYAARVQLEERVEVDAAVQQRAVVRSGHGEEAALEVLGDRHDGDAEDAALAAARVVGLGGVDEPAAGEPNWNAGSLLKPSDRVGHQPPEEQVVQEPLMQALGDAVEQRVVADRRDDAGDVGVRHALHVDAGDDEVGALGQLGQRAELEAAAQQTVAPRGGTTRDGLAAGVHRDVRDVDDERHRGLAVLPRHAVDQVEPAGRLRRRS